MKCMGGNGIGNIVMHAWMQSSVGSREWEDW